MLKITEKEGFLFLQILKFTLFVQNRFQKREKLGLCTAFMAGGEVVFHSTNITFRAALSTAKSTSEENVLVILNHLQTRFP